ncbi:hypothetical protein O0S10_06725 [Methanocorpusculum sp. MG]|uniref:Uncharacterized protein n=1 Tax=Methanocorpusculum petauri TaxID=3002863 RepID=A0ABT4IGQ4_9EURY|nr:hypothetical protein [Methanocorpusculum petauri]MCZ0860919.1 hypothetical protein [Methanocorpusculum petauri]
MSGSFASIAVACAIVTHEGGSGARFCRAIVTPKGEESKTSGLAIATPKGERSTVLLCDSDPEGGAEHGSAVR